MDRRLPAIADRRLIEHYLPIEALSAEARREKSVRKGHISTLHLWWARRPPVATSAASPFCSLATSGLRPNNLGRAIWLYVVWNPTEPGASLMLIQSPANRLEHAARDVRAISY